MSLVVAVQDVAKITVRTQLDAQAGENLLFLHVTAIGGTPTYQTIANGMFTLIGAALPALMTDAAGLEFCLAQRLYPLPIGASTRSTNPRVGGTAGTQPLPKQVAGLIWKKGDFAGRHNQGRFYVPFPDEADSDPDGVPNAAYLVRLDALAALMANPITFVSGMDSVTGNFVLVSKVRPVNPALVVPITAQGSRPLWATQRSRGDFSSSNPL